MTPAVAAISETLSAPVASVSDLPDPAKTDPVALGWMQGAPPPPDKIVRFEDGSFLRYPQTRWSFSHIRELRPTVNVWRGNGAISMLPEAPAEIDAMSFIDEQGQSSSWAAMLQRTYSDSIMVLHRGQVIYERYFGVATPYLQHSAFSVTKSFIGLLAAMMVDEGTLDPDALVSSYVPDIRDSAYGDATVRQVMDMTIGVRYTENYADPTSEVWDYARAGGMVPVPPSYNGPTNFYAFLANLKKEGQHGDAFAYKTCNSEMLAWILRRVMGKPVSQLMSEKIWQKLGAENDAYFQVDSIGVESGGGGLSLPLRDMARFGEMMRLGGQFNGRRIVSESVVDDIRRGGDPGKFAKMGFPDIPGYGKGYSYRSMFWISHNANGVFDARGIHGQRIYIDPAAEMVVAKFSSHPLANNMNNIPISDRAFAALAKELSR